MVNSNFIFKVSKIVQYNKNQVPLSLQYFNTIKISDDYVLKYNKNKYLSEPKLKKEEPSKSNRWRRKAEHSRPTRSTIIQSNCS